MADPDPTTTRRGGRKPQQGPCAVFGCGKAINARGWCDLHYRRWWVHGDPLTLKNRPQPDRCQATGCEHRPWSRGLCSIHYGKAYYSKNREGCNRRSKKWKDEHPEQHRERTRRWRQENPQRGHLISIKNKYGITGPEYERLLVGQAGACAICRRPESRRQNGRVCSLAVDHDHATGLVRGLLCQGCNTAIGLVREDRDILMSMVAYLQRTNRATERGA